MTDLAALIERLEKASEPDKKLWMDAYEAIHGRQNITLRWGRFLVLIDVGAWLDAAVMLVPEGRLWSVGQRTNASGFVACTSQSHKSCIGTTSALALSIAALKAGLADA